MSYQMTRNLIYVGIDQYLKPLVTFAFFQALSKIFLHPFLVTALSSTTQLSSTFGSHWHNILCVNVGSLPFFFFPFLQQHPCKNIIAKLQVTFRVLPANFDMKDTTI